MFFYGSEIVRFLYMEQRYMKQRYAPERPSPLRRSESVPAWSETEPERKCKRKREWERAEGACWPCKVGFCGQ